MKNIINQRFKNNWWWKCDGINVQAEHLIGNQLKQNCILRSVGTFGAKQIKYNAFINSISPKIIEETVRYIITMFIGVDILSYRSCN